MIFDLVINLFESMLFIFFLYSLPLTHKPNSIWLSIGAVIINFAAMSAVNYFSPSQSLFFTVFTAFYFLYLCLISNERKELLIIYALLPMTIAAMTNTVFDITFILALGNGRSFLELLSLYGIPTTLTVQLIHVICFYFVVKKLKDKLPKLSSRECIILSLLLLTACTVSTCLETVYLDYENTKSYLAIGVYCSSAFIILIAILFNLIYARISLENKLNLENTILKTQLSSNEQILKAQQNIHSLRHDIKHLITLLKENNNQPMSDEIKDVIKKYDTVKEKRFDHFNTAIPAVNYVLNVKREEAIEKGIDLKCTLNITHDPGFETEDLFLLLSNLLDNAIKHIGFNKRIDLEIKEIEELFCVTITNSVNGQVLDENNEFIVKGGSKEHGFGIKTIELLANKYDGYISCRQIGGDVVVTVYLDEPFPQIEQENAEDSK